MSQTSRRQFLVAITLLGVLTLAVFSVRLIGPSDLLDNDQLRPAAYALDVVLHGRWAVQTDYGGDVASKPPLYTWLVALASLPTQRVTLLTLYLPCAIAVGATAMLAFAIARRTFGDMAAFMGGIMLLLSAYGFKHVALARTDAVFMATVTLTACLTVRAWTICKDSVRSKQACTAAWTLAWIAAALATLTKGPLGLILGAAGLVAMFWERRSGRTVPLRGSHWPGLAVYLVLCGGWFAAAYMSAGQPFLDKVIGRELVGHVVGASKEELNAQPLFERVGAFALGLAKPTVYLVTRFLPWSLFTLVGVWRVVRSPCAVDTERRLERFLVCWLVVGLALFSVMPHQRADLLLPLTPAAALLAGREAARIMSGVGRRASAALAAVIGLVAMTAGSYEYHVRSAESKERVRTAQARAVATDVQAFISAHSDVRVMDVDASGGVQFFLGMKEPRVDTATALEALNSSVRVVVLTRNPHAIGTFFMVSRRPASGEMFAAAITNMPERSRD